MATNIDPAVEKATQEFCAKFKTLRAEIGKAIVGQEEIVEGVLTALFVGGNVLLEAYPDWEKRIWCARWPRRSTWSFRGFSSPPT
jgi:MoxR-like ATPase